MRYVHQLKEWPSLKWDQESMAQKLAAIRHRQGRLLGRMEALGFTLRADAVLQTITLDVLKSTEIEGEFLDPLQVRSSVARHLGMDIAGLVPSDRHIDGVVEMLLDATRNYNAPLTADRLFGWNNSLFPGGRNGMYKVETGKWRTNEKGPMQVVSGPIGYERIHFIAPDAMLLEDEMMKFMNWFNNNDPIDPVLKAGIAHFWFVTIHPFDDGNGRIARAITDMLLTRADGSDQRFYSMSAQVRKERNEYYNQLERAQRGDLDITDWLVWFLECLDRSLTATDETLAHVIQKARFWEQHRATDLNNRQRMMLNKLLDGFEGKLTSSKWAKIAKCSQDTALRDLQNLIDKGMLTKEPGGGRSTSYILTDV